MARSTGTFFTGTITGTNNVEDLQVELETRIKAFQSNGGNAWEEWDLITATAGSRDVVFRSKGDRTLLSGAGDAHLLIRVSQTAATTIRFRAYQDWSNSSSTGSNEAGSTATTNGSWTSLSATQDIEFWGISNEYEFTMVMVQGGTYRGISFGSPKRSHVPTLANGIAFTSNAETAGSSVVIELDRDITANITVGQKIWIYNVTPNATSLRAANLEIVTVDAKAAGSITVDALANSYDAGAIVGQDPSPMYLTTSQDLSFALCYFTNHADGSYESATLNTTTIEVLLAPVLESVNDPNPNSLYMGSEALLDDADPVAGGFRGVMEFCSWWTVGTQADQDRMIPNFTTADARKVFPSMLSTSLALAIGPGATA